MLLQSKLLWWLFNLKVASCNCHSEIKKSGFERGGHFYKVSKPIQMPKEINEGSGLIRTSKDSTFWTHNDGGGKTELYEIDKQGHLLSTLPLPKAKNRDWEEITRDDKGNIYVGDFGNNDNTKRELIIYKFPENNPDKMEKISFHYANQERFPPDKKDRNFDCEAFLARGHSLYLFSKNRGDKSVKLYVLPTQAGEYALLPKDNIFIKTMVTGAALSPDKKQFALLTYGKVFLFSVDNQEVNFRNPIKCFKFAHKQTEAIVFVDSNNLIITNEQGELFRVRID
jgi:hypothetical protein